MEKTKINKKIDASKIVSCANDEIPKAVVPFDDEQVNSLNGYQNSTYHPYTCGGKNCREILVATNDGWVCKKCGYMQMWAHRFSADWSWKKYEYHPPI